MKFILADAEVTLSLEEQVPDLIKNSELISILVEKEGRDVTIDISNHSLAGFEYFFASLYGLSPYSDNDFTQLGPLLHAIVISDYLEIDITNLRKQLLSLLSLAAQEGTYVISNYIMPVLIRSVGNEEFENEIIEKFNSIRRRQNYEEIHRNFQESMFSKNGIPLNIDFTIEGEEEPIPVIVPHQVMEYLILGSDLPSISPFSVQILTFVLAVEDDYQVWWDFDYALRTVVNVSFFDHYAGLAPVSLQKAIKDSIEFNRFILELNTHKTNYELFGKMIEDPNTNKELMMISLLSGEKNFPYYRQRLQLLDKLNLNYASMLLFYFSLDEYAYAYFESDIPRIIDELWYRVPKGSPKQVISKIYSILEKRLRR